MAPPLTKSLPNGLAQCGAGHCERVKGAPPRASSVKLMPLYENVRRHSHSPVIEAGSAGSFGENRVRQSQRR